MRKLEFKDSKRERKQSFVRLAFADAKGLKTTQ